MKKNVAILLLSIMAIVVAYVKYNAKSNSSPVELQEYMHVYLDNNAEIVITDPNGGKLGVNPITGEKFKTIPGGYDYTGIGNPDVGTSTEPQEYRTGREIYTPKPLDGEFKIEVFGITTGSYFLSINILKNSGVYRDFVNGKTEKDKTDTYYFTLDSTKADNIQVRGETLK